MEQLRRKWHKSDLRMFRSFKGRKRLYKHSGTYSRLTMIWNTPRACSSKQGDNPLCFVNPLTMLFIAESLLTVHREVEAGILMPSFLESSPVNKKETYIGTETQFYTTRRIIIAASNIISNGT